MIRDIITNKEKLALTSEKIYDQAEAERIIKDMIDTANYYRTKPVGCIGLAANQIGELHRIIIIWRDNDWLVMINPELTLIKGKAGYMTEGCLSRPGVASKLKRNKKVMVTYFDMVTDSLVEQKFSGMAARVIQHEYDHLNGVYI